MNRFLEDANGILEVARNGMAAGHAAAPLTILIGGEGGLRIVADSDWPLDSLQSLHGARTAYRVGSIEGLLRVEGREGGMRCRIEAEPPERAARMLLGVRPRARRPDRLALPPAAC